MKTSYKTLLMATAAFFVTSGAYADNYGTGHGEARSSERTQQMDSDRQSEMRNQPQDQSLNQQGQNQRTLSNAEIRTIQESLNDEGYNVSVDGVWGQQTAEALRAYERDNNRASAAGQLDHQTLSDLGVDMDRTRSRY